MGPDFFSGSAEVYYEEEKRLSSDPGATRACVKRSILNILNFFFRDRSIRITRKMVLCPERDSGPNFVKAIFVRNFSAISAKTCSGGCAFQEL
jgi:hypothetical protein